jgi:hypothetical protein
MNHWLDKAESRRQKASLGKSALKKKIEQKKAEIALNYEQHKAEYDGFVNTLHDLVKRANELPEKHRHSFRKINASKKKDKLNNQLSIFSSSKREQNYSLFSFFKPLHSKHIRVFYVHVSKRSGVANLEVKENYLLRKRISDDTKSKSHEQKKEAGSTDRVHVLMRFKMSDLSKEIAYQILDWLAFKNDLEKLSFWTETPMDEKRFF